MLLTTILSQARGAELKSLSAKDKTDEVIIGYLNLALVALYSRFFIKTQEAIIALQLGKTLYKLDGTDTDVTVLGQPMVADSVLAIVNVYDETGTEITLNDTNSLLGVFQQSYDTLQIPVTEDNAVVAIIYRENPILLDAEALCLDTGNLDPLNNSTDVFIPLQLLAPLLHYIGYRAHGSVAGTIQDENNTHYMRYVASCREVDKQGVASYTNLQSRDVEDKGFV